MAAVENFSSPTACEGCTGSSAQALYGAPPAPPCPDCSLFSECASSTSCSLRAFVHVDSSVILSSPSWSLLSFRAQLRYKVAAFATHCSSLSFLYSTLQTGTITHFQILIALCWYFCVVLCNGYLGRYLISHQNCKFLENLLILITSKVSVADSRCSLNIHGIWLHY